ncbi:MAG: 1-deoxy-D-xylulose-5-phosphate reductoisomerase, partial [Proteobacteria bacterium]|nr:1-deoxy-D-xylulose-5-phosphate reductoisomerase [Pseudomonadota bacterium]
SLARQAAEAGGAMPAVLNAANEVAVDAFLNEKIRFIDIPSLISKVMDKFSPEVPINLDEVLLVDQSARKIAYKVLKNTFQS